MVKILHEENTAERTRTLPNSARVSESSRQFKIYKPIPKILSYRPYEAETGPEPLNFGQSAVETKITKQPSRLQPISYFFSQKEL